MNGAAFRFAIRHSIRSAAFLALGLGLFYWVTLLSSSSFLGDGDQPLPEFLTEPPRTLQALIGGSGDFLSPTGWLASGMLHPIVLALTSMGALMVVAGTGSAELERGTLDLVLSRPITRRAYLISRASAGLMLLTLVVVGGLTGTLISRVVVDRVDQLPIGKTVMGFGAMWLLYAGFAMIGLWIFARSHLRSRALGAVIAVVVLSFFVNFVSLLFDVLSWLGYLSPFHYFNIANIIEGRGFVGHMVVLAGISVGAGALALWEFERRDLTR